MSEDYPRNFVETVESYFYKIFINPTIWFKKTYIEPNQKEYNWYHRQYRRVPTIDQCYTDDAICEYEADVQYKRDRRVDSFVLYLLRQRYIDCRYYYRREGRGEEVCAPMYDTYLDNETNFFIKYGDLKIPEKAINAYMKQKHRLIWERRHGPVGSGMKEKIYKKDGTYFYK